MFVPKPFTIKQWLLGVPLAFSVLTIVSSQNLQPVKADTETTLAASTDNTAATKNDFTASNFHSQAAIQQGLLGDAGRHTFTKADINQTGSTSKTHYLRMPNTITGSAATAWLAFAKQEASADYAATGREQNIVQIAATVETFSIGQAGYPRVDTIDVSSYQYQMNQTTYNNLRAKGVKAIIVKTTEGTTYANPYAKTQLQQAERAGMQVAAYHYAHFGTAKAATTEANYFAAKLSSLGFPKNSPVIADLEDKDLSGNVAANLNAFWQALSSKGYNNHALYTGRFFDWSDAAIATVGQARTWIAQYPYQPRANNLWNTDFGAWQFSSQARIAGYNGNLDASIDYKNLFTQTTSPSPKPSTNHNSPESNTSHSFDKVTGTSSLNQVGRIYQAGRADGLYSAPYNTNSDTQSANSNARYFNGQAVAILARSTTTRAASLGNTFYKIRLTNGDIHWIDARGIRLVTLNRVTSRSTLSGTARINQSGRRDGLYTAPWNTDYLSITENHNAAIFNGQSVQLVAEATTSRSSAAGNRFYQIKLRDGRRYWIDARGIQRNTLPAPTNQKAVHYTAVIWQSGRADGLYSHPFGSNADSMTPNTDAKKYTGRGVIATAEATTRQGTYVNVTLPNGSKRWVDKRALMPITYDKIASTSSVNKSGRILQAGRADGLYSAPYYTDAMSVLENHNAIAFNNQKVTVLKKAITTRNPKAGNQFYQIRLSNGRVLWIDSRGVKLG
ncbi:GW dipeptide domain-containing protein [Lacticaseibacillus jixianensis]|uniref:GW dipeptide domain-containing protein n=1 Tax=Lacticaseibacillus jixianensis TaxID=2486012 RepID=A0ABW4BCN7_9LACO|nr:GW dipeptide domain-containing protein [Lacticaseibacillus jixianensis]